MVNSHELFENIVVLFEATERQYEEGYFKAIDTFSLYNKIKWLRESDFQEDTLRLIERSCEHICFFVDDNIMYRSPLIDVDVIDYLFEESQLATFSLRLGRNTVIQNYYTNMLTKMPEDFEDVQLPHTERMLLNDWTKLPRAASFGYPFSVDGHIYRKKDLLGMIEYEFDNPNGLEGRFDVNLLPPLLACLEQSCVVNNPMNLVGSSNNAAGRDYGMTLEYLNQEYLSGKRLDLNKIDFGNVVACHQEFKLGFTA